MFKVFNIKATLRDVQPVVWRKIKVGEDITFYKLQKSLQEYFGWPVSKFSTFLTKGNNIFQKHGTQLRVEGLNSIITRLSVFNFISGDTIELRQNLMDDWMFDMIIESVEYSHKSGVISCTGYRGTTPPINYSGPDALEFVDGASYIPQIMGTLHNIR